MKHFLTTFVLAVALVATASCAKDDEPGSTNPDKTVQFTISSTDGTSVNFSTKESFTSGTSTYFSAYTSSTTASSFVALDIKTNSCLDIKAGKELEIKSFALCKPLSSNSNDYSTKFTGKIYLINYPGSAGQIATIRFNNVKCSLGEATYTLNGDMQFNIIEN